MPKIVVPEFKGLDAWVYLVASFVFLLTHPKVGFLLYILIPGAIWNEVSHYTGYEIKIQAAEPAVPERIDTTSHSYHFSLMPEAVAQDKKSFDSTDEKVKQEETHNG